MIKTDFNFGLGLGLMEDKDLELVKGSPSHESDSGISSGSSPSYSMASEDDISDDNYKETLGSLDDFDEELTSYLQATNKIDESDNFVYSPVLSTPSTSPLCVDELLSQTAVSEPLEISPVIDIPELTKLQDNVIQTRSASTKQIKPVTTKATTISISKPGTSLPKKRVVDTKKKEIVQSSNLPPVKVIKVISAPSSQAKNETEKKIFEAIDERNRKNAIQAKINREKKKSYIKGLEMEIDCLKEENTVLRDGKDKMEQTVNVLEEEVQYLRNIIANQSALSNLLKNIPNVNNVKLTSSFSQRKRAASHDHDYQGPTKQQKLSAGVCLHVQNDSASLEFCSKCSSMSQISSDDEES